MLKQKKSNLIACYLELASGEAVEHLLQKYVKVEVLVAQELFERGVTLKELAEFIRKRDAHIEFMLNEKSEHSRYTTPPDKKVIQQ